MITLRSARPGDEVFTAAGDSCGVVTANGAGQLVLALDGYSTPLRIDHARQQDRPTILIPIDHLKRAFGAR